MGWLYYSAMSKFQNIYTNNKQADQLDEKFSNQKQVNAKTNLLV